MRRPRWTVQGPIPRHMARCSGSLSPRQNFLPTWRRGPGTDRGAGFWTCTGGLFLADGSIWRQRCWLMPCPKAGVRGRDLGAPVGAFVGARADTPGYQKTYMLSRQGIWRFGMRAAAMVTMTARLFHWEDATSWEPARTGWTASHEPAVHHRTRR